MMRCTVPNTSPNTRARPVDLALLALQQRDLLAVFAHPREVETEIRLDRLLPEIERPTICGR